MPKIYTDDQVNEAVRHILNIQRKPLPRGNLSSMARARAKEQPIISHKEPPDSDDEVNGHYFCGVDALSGQRVRISCPNSRCKERVCLKNKFDCSFPNEFF